MIFVSNINYQESNDFELSNIFLLSLTLKSKSFTAKNQLNNR